MCATGWRQSAATFGRQLLNTPLLNPQDGRLSPAYAQGLWLEFRELPAHHAHGRLAHAHGPRSTPEWYSVANSVGLYPMGVTEAGKRAATPAT